MTLRLHRSYNEHSTGVPAALSSVWVLPHSPPDSNDSPAGPHVLLGALKDPGVLSSTGSIEKRLRDWSAQKLSLCVGKGSSTWCVNMCCSTDIPNPKYEQAWRSGNPEYKLKVLVSTGHNVALAFPSKWHF